jgi:hypothetical protein
LLWAGRVFFTIKPPLVNSVAALMFTMVGVACAPTQLLKRARRPLALVFLVGWAGVLLWWNMITPSHSRDFRKGWRR